jgi:hypothetical protein
MVFIFGVGGVIAGLVIGGVSLLCFVGAKREGKPASWLLYILVSVVAAALICLLGAYAGVVCGGPSGSPPTMEDFMALAKLWAIWGASPGLGLLVGLLTLLRKRGASQPSAAEGASQDSSAVNLSGD